MVESYYLTGCCARAQIVLLQEITVSNIESPSGLDPFQLILEAGPVSIIVLILLVGFSLISWAIILSKWIILRRADKHSETFLEVFRSSKKFSDVHAICHELHASPLAGIFLSGYNELNYQLKSRSGESEYEHQSASLQNLDSLARSLVRSSNQEVLKLEERLPFLATTGSATPFIGLFGTVWGIMNAFQSIGVTESANISVVAPGVSEALIATAAGLAAAIPAVIFYNFFLNWVKRISTQMDDFALEYLTIIERNFT